MFEKYVEVFYAPLISTLSEKLRYEPVPAHSYPVCLYIDSVYFPGSNEKPSTIYNLCDSCRILKL